MIDVESGMVFSATSEATTMGANYEQNSIQPTFSENKIVSAIAEMACRMHFTELGYVVESFGQEHIYPAYLAFKSQHLELGQYTQNVESLIGEQQHQPDFLISRIQRSQNDAPITQACLVEAKFRSTAPKEGDGFTKKLFADYAQYIEKNQHIVFYVVTGVEKGADPAVYLNFTLAPRWYRADARRLLEFDLYFGAQGRARTYNVWKKNQADEWERRQSNKWIREDLRESKETTLAGIYNDVVRPALMRVFR